MPPRSMNFREGQSLPRGQVSSGSPEVKEAAGFVTDALYDDGIYHAMQHFGLLGEGSYALYEGRHNGKE